MCVNAAVAIGLVCLIGAVFHVGVYAERMNMLTREGSNSKLTDEDIS